MPVQRRRVYGGDGPPPAVPGFTWNPVEGTMGSQWQLPQYEATPIPGYQAPGTGTTVGAGSLDPGVPALPDYSQIQNLISQINATNQAAQHSANLNRIPGAEGLEAQSSRNIMDLLNPPDVLAEIDVGGAARAVGSGTSGSPFGGITGINLSENEKIRRRMLGQQQLNMAYGRNPAAPIGDPQALAQLLQQQGFAGGQSAADRALRLQLAQMERDTALAIANMRNAGRFGSGGDGGYYGPRVPTDYGRGATAAPSPTFRAGIPDFPDYSGGGGSSWMLPSGAVPENMADLTGQQQMDYANMWWNNPYNQIPEVLNPYAADYNPLDPSLAAYYE